MASSSTQHIIDDARVHFRLGNFRGLMPIEQAYLHIGIFLGWVIESELYSSFFEEEGETAIFRFESRAITCIILGELWEGIISYDLLNKEAQAFAKDYYVSGKYLEDYKEALAQELKTIYQVEDTEENYQVMYHLLNRRFEEWQKDS